MTPTNHTKGGTNYGGDYLLVSEGTGNDTAPGIYLVNPLPPYNTTLILNNFFGRQFNSLNDVSISPVNGDIYFTDTLYGYLQMFRPPPALPNQVYRFNPNTGAVTVVADGFDLPNGLQFSPNGSYAYVTDTGAQLANFGYNQCKSINSYEPSSHSRRAAAIPCPVHVLIIPTVTLLT